jgi:cytochrome c oxidase assembly protein Cox11
MQAKPITVHFSASTSDSMPWTFRPQQKSVVVVPGETALAFYTAHNPSGEIIAKLTGILQPTLCDSHVFRVQIRL